MANETTSNVPGEAALSNNWEQFVRRERLLDALFLAYTVRDAQAQGAFGRSDWLQNLESVVMSNLIRINHSNEK